MCSLHRTTHLVYRIISSSSSASWFSYYKSELMLRSEYLTKIICWYIFLSFLSSHFMMQRIRFFLYSSNISLVCRCCVYVFMCKNTENNQSKEIFLNIFFYWKKHVYIKKYRLSRIFILSKLWLVENIHIFLIFLFLY